MSDQREDGKDFEREADALGRVGIPIVDEDVERGVRVARDEVARVRHERHGTAVGREGGTSRSRIPFSASVLLELFFLALFTLTSLSIFSSKWLVGMIAVLPSNIKAPSAHLDTMSCLLRHNPSDN